MDLDVYDNVEHASVDAYIASEEGQAMLQGCGVSALVPLATAIQRLADNDINITVILPPTLFNRFDSEGNATLLVNAQGQLVSFIEGNNTSYFVWKAENQEYQFVDATAYSSLTTAWGSSSLGTWTIGQDKIVTVDGVEYTFAFQMGRYVLTPAAGTYNG